MSRKNKAKIEGIGKPRIIDWILTPVFFSLFLIILVIYEILYRISVYFPKCLSYEWVFKTFNRLILINLQLTALTKFESSFNCPQQALPVVVISNHQSMFDIPFLCVAFSKLKLRFVAKTELARGIPGISIALRNGEHAIIDRSDPEQALPEMQRAASLSRQKDFALVVFPEGTRSRNGNLRQFKAGGIAKIVETLGEVIILPVAIKGSWKIAQHSLKPISVGNKVQVILTEGIRVKAGEDVDTYMSKAREQIQMAINGASPRPLS